MKGKEERGRRDDYLGIRSKKAEIMDFRGLRPKGRKKAGTK